MKEINKKTRTINKRILILCEDEKSSLLYFKGFKKDEKFKRDLASVSIEVYHPDNYSPLGLLNSAREKIKKAKKDRNSYDEVWLVFDKDGHANIPQVFEEAKVSKINIAFSNKCFEYWILLHFEFTSKPFDKCDDIISHIKNKHIKDYNKSTDVFQLIKNRMETAIKNAENLSKNLEPDKKVYELSVYTNVHDLVSIIINKKNESRFN